MGGTPSAENTLLWDPAHLAHLHLWCMACLEGWALCHSRRAQLLFTLALRLTCTGAGQ